MPHFNNQQIQLLQMKSYLPMHSVQFVVVQHCNANCKHCFFCSPIAPVKECTADELLNSIEFIKTYNQDVDPAKVFLTGGDCFLHSNLPELAVITRKAFPKAMIRLSANGLEIPNVSDADWKVYRDNRIAVKIRSYDLQDTAYCFKKCREMGVECGCYEHPITDQVMFSKNLLKKEPMLWSIANFARCQSWGQCLICDTLVQRFYKCDRIVGWRFLLEEEELSKYLKNNIDYWDYSDLSKVDFEAMRVPHIPRACMFCDYGTHIQNRTTEGIRCKEEWLA
jgi:hypothetical protein